MDSSSITVKGQVTIPAAIRKRLGLERGDRVEFVPKGNKVYLQRKENRIEAAFGLFKAKRGASLQQIEKTVRENWEKRGRR